MQKPGEFKKKKKKYKNVQYNQDQIKLLKSGKVSLVDLFILDPNGFKRVTIIPITNDNECIGMKVVYLQRGKKKRLRTGTWINKDGRFIYEVNGFVKEKDIYGLVIKEEMLKGN